MVTFEDFFAKKKIDLQALRRDKPELYTEFYAHYYAMGEKSFDHTKKFWFNRLRKSYKLNEIEPTVEKVETAVQSTTTPLSASSLGFKPRFKAKTSPATSENINTEVEKESTASTQENKPTDFKPRFKAGVTKKSDQEEKDYTAKIGADKRIEESSAIENKPKGFKPRFKAGVTKTENTSLNTPQQTAPINETLSNKPAGFKPRFKAGITKTTKAEDAETDTDRKDEDNTSVENKPKGFTPRFKAKTNKTNED